MEYIINRNISIITPETISLSQLERKNRFNKIKRQIVMQERNRNEQKIQDFLYGLSCLPIL